MDDPADGSSQNRPGWYQLDGCVSTRNRKVEGSNPSSGSKAAGQRALPALLTARRQQAVIPFGCDRAAPLRYVGVPPASLLRRGLDAP
jgi:hypothetical protein